MVPAGITAQWGKGRFSSLQKEGMETHRRDKLVLDISGFQALSRALNGIKVVLLGVGTPVLSQGIP